MHYTYNAHNSMHIIYMDRKCYTVPTHNSDNQKSDTLFALTKMSLFREENFEKLSYAGLDLSFLVIVGPRFWELIQERPFLFRISRQR